MVVSIHGDNGKEAYDELSRIRRRCSVQKPYAGRLVNSLDSRVALLSYESIVGIVTGAIPIATMSPLKKLLASSSEMVSRLLFSN